MSHIFHNASLHKCICLSGDGRHTVSIVQCLHSAIVTTRLTDVVLKHALPLGSCLPYSNCKQEDAFIHPPLFTLSLAFE